jgi:hypothetical protein
MFKHPKHAMMDPRPVDLVNRLSGSQHALKSMGIQTAGPNLGDALQDLGKTRMGIMPEPAPGLRSTPMGAYTTSGTLTNPKVAAAEDAPNYTEASSTATSCGSCQRFSKRTSDMGECDKYDFYARNDYTCDGWVSRQPSTLLRTKLRAL